MSIPVDDTRVHNRFVISTIVTSTEGLIEISSLPFGMFNAFTPLLHKLLCSTAVAQLYPGDWPQFSQAATVKSYTTTKM